MNSFRRKGYHETEQLESVPPRMGRALSVQLLCDQEL
jgi:hypothetical protein